MVLNLSKIAVKVFAFIKANGGYARPSELYANVPHSPGGITNGMLDLRSAGEVVFVEEKKGRSLKTIWVCLPKLKPMLETLLDLEAIALKVLEEKGGFCSPKVLKEELSTKSGHTIGPSKFNACVKALITEGKIVEIMQGKHKTKCLGYALKKHEARAKLEMGKNPKREKILELVALGPVISTELNKVMFVDYLVQGLFQEKHRDRRVHKKRFPRKERRGWATVFFLDKDRSIVNKIGKSSNTLLRKVEAEVARHEFVYMEDIEVGGIARGITIAILVDLELRKRIIMRFVEVDSKIRKIYSTRSNKQKVENLAANYQIKLS